jgi:type II secretory pathway pseudopilin PulG
MSGRPPRSRVRPQRGAALIASILLFAVIGISTFLVLTRGGSTDDAQRALITQQALTQAKAALIGYASAVPFTGPERPGDLPCPDLDNDGDADTPCSSAASRLGRLPWRTLGLPDLRDGAGERLWYAVSTAFKNNPRTPCAAPTDAGCLNSDTRGTITVRNASQAIVHDGTNPDPLIPSGAVAVIFAPGEVIRRQGGAALQDRSCTLGSDCDQFNRCTSSPATNTPLCNPINYLDNITAGEDNADFADSTHNGVIGGPVKIGLDLIVNDRVAVIAYNDIVPLLELRVAREVSACLDQYASPANLYRYPWATDTSDSAVNNRFADQSGLRAGRVPDGLIGGVTADQLLTNTRTASGNVMEERWPGFPCNLGRGFAWWDNWKLHVFYAVAEQFKPGSGEALPPCLDCLSVSSPGVFTAGVRYAIIVSGRPLNTGTIMQSRALPGDRANPSNYLEGDNDFSVLTADLFESRRRSATFNDVTVYK